MSALRKEVLHMSEGTRLALLEQSIGHINETMIRIEKKFDAIDFRFDRLEKRMDNLSDETRQGFTRLDNKIDSNFKWLLGFYIGGFSALFALISHGLHWI